VLDPFGGAGTTGLVADRHGRDAILIELNPEYAEMARKRIFNDSPLFAEVMRSMRRAGSSWNPTAANSVLRLQRCSTHRKRWCAMRS
jgi:hypothetical protein